MAEQFRVNLVGVSKVKPMPGKGGEPLRVRGFIGDVISEYELLTEAEIPGRIAELNAAHKTDDFEAAIIPQSERPTYYF